MSVERLARWLVDFGHDGDAALVRDLADQLATAQTALDAVNAELVAEREHGDATEPSTEAQRRESYEWGKAAGYNDATARQHR